MAAMQAELTNNAKADANVSRLQRRPQPMAELVNRYPDREEAMVAAHRSGAYAYQILPTLYFTAVGRIVQNARGSNVS